MCLVWSARRLRCGFAEPLTKEPSNSMLSPSSPLPKPLLTISVGTAAGRRSRARCWPRCARHSRPGPRSLYVTTLLRAVRSCLTDFALRCVCACVVCKTCPKESLRRISLSQLALLASRDLGLPKRSCHPCGSSFCLSQLTARPVRRRELRSAREINVPGNSATRVPAPARTGRKWPPRKTNHPRNRRAGQSAGSGPPRGPARGDGDWGTRTAWGEREEGSLTTRSGSCPGLASGRRGI